MQGSYIAVVDDDKGMCRALRRLLRVYELDVSLYNQGFDFLSAINGRVPDCVIMDVELPDFNGLELYRKVRCDHPDLPVILITAWEDESLRDRAIEIGAKAFFYKPFGEKPFMEEVNNALGRGPEGTAKN